MRVYRFVVACCIFRVFDDFLMLWQPIVLTATFAENLPLGRTELCGSYLRQTGPPLGSSLTRRTVKRISLWPISLWPKYLPASAAVGVANGGSRRLYCQLHDGKSRGKIAQSFEDRRCEFLEFRPQFGDVKHT